MEWVRLSWLEALNYQPIKQLILLEPSTRLSPSWVIYSDTVLLGPKGEVLSKPFLADVEGSTAGSQTYIAKERFLSEVMDLHLKNTAQIYASLAYTKQLIASSRELLRNR